MLLLILQNVYTLVCDYEWLRVSINEEAHEDYPFAEQTVCVVID